MTRLWQRWFAPPEPTTLDTLRAITKGSTPKVRVIYATPERDEHAKACVHIWSDGDDAALELQEQSNVIQMRGAVR